MTQIEKMFHIYSGSFVDEFNPSLLLDDLNQKSSLQPATDLLADGYLPVVSWLVTDPDGKNVTIAQGMANHLEYRDTQGRDELDRLFKAGALVGPAVLRNMEEGTFSLYPGISIWYPPNILLELNINM